MVIKVVIKAIRNGTVVRGSNSIHEVRDSNLIATDIQKKIKIKIVMNCLKICVSQLRVVNILLGYYGFFFSLFYEYWVIRLGFISFNEIYFRRKSDKSHVLMKKSRLYIMTSV